jgi:hypothetical protein
VSGIDFRISLNRERAFESDRSAAGTGKLTVEDLRRAADAAKDLDDRQVMKSAWR